jgi:hypothetical protein
MKGTQEKINDLNNASFGSFGEFIFETINIGTDISRKHSGRVDFVHNGELIDVKSTRRFKELYKKSKNYSGSKIDGIKYPYIQFYKDKVICVLFEEICFELDYGYINNLYAKWMKSKSIKNLAKRVKLDSKELDSIKFKLTTYFEEHNYKVRIIYRTTQRGLGKESPGNLKPKKIISKRVTIFLNFKDHNLSEDNLLEIFVIKDSVCNNLPMIDKPTLHMEKVDLEKIKQYRYETIKSVIDNWVQ